MSDSEEFINDTPRYRVSPSWYQWGFNLDGGANWLEGFTGSFTSVDVQILPEYEDDKPTFFDFTSPHLNGLSGAQASMRARELLILFNGIMRVSRGLAYRTLSIGAGHDLWTHEPAREDFLDTAAVSMFPEDVESLRYFSHHWSNRRHDPVSKQLFLSRSDRYLRTIYRTLGREGVTFISLSKVLDTIVADFQERGAKGTNAEVGALGGKHEDAVEAFKYTANNFDVAGEAARHGLKANFKPAKKIQPLSLRESADVILPIVRGFVFERVERTFETKWRSVLIDRADQADPAPSPPERTSSASR